MNKEKVKAWQIYWIIVYVTWEPSDNLKGMVLVPSTPSTKKKSGFCGWPLRRMRDEAEGGGMVRETLFLGPSFWDVMCGLPDGCITLNWMPQDSSYINVVLYIMYTITVIIQAQ